MQGNLFTVHAKAGQNGQNGHVRASPKRPETGQNGQIPLGMSVLSGGDGPGQSHKAKTNTDRAWNAWVAEGKPWPPPAGLTSALIDAVTPSPHGRKQWR